MADNQKVVLITGCSTGIGLKTAAKLAKDEKKRFKVYATMRSLGKKGALEEEAGDCLEKTLFIEVLDVTEEKSINESIDKILSKEGRIDVIVNNAGVGVARPAEVESNETIERVFATNVFGPMKLIRKLLPFWKEKQSGQAITITSVAGIIGFPFSTTYAASKFAIEGYMESLAFELFKFENIKATLIEPGPVVTHFAQNADIKDTGNVDKATAEEFDRGMKTMFAHFEGKWQQGEEVADVVLEAITTSKPHLRYSTNPHYEDYIKAKYTDTTGDNIMKATREIFEK